MHLWAEDGDLVLHLAVICAGRKEKDLGLAQGELIKGLGWDNRVQSDREEGAGLSCDIARGPEPSPPPPHPSLSGDMGCGLGFGGAGFG
jgi:hypothetical protein